MLNKRLRPITIGFLLFVLFAWFQISHNPQVSHLRQRIELLLYDLRLTATLPKKPKIDKRIVIVDIDEASLRSEGRWPWSRNKMAQMTNHILQAGAIVIAFDVMFSEKERNSAYEVQQKLKKTVKPNAEIDKAIKNIIPEFDYDAEFARALAQGDTILGYIFHRNKVDSSGVLPAALKLADQSSMANTSFVTMSGYTSNIELLQAATKGAGFFSLDADTDGILRRAPLMIKYQEKIYSSLALETVRIFYLLDVVDIQAEMIGSTKAISGLKLGVKKFIPTDGEGKVIIPYRGGSKSYQYISASSVLSKNFSKDVFENAIVLVGTTAEGIFDLRPTPMQSVYPGVEVHANIISGLLDGKFPAEPAWARGANLVLLSIAGLLLVFWLPFIKAFYQVVLSLMTSIVFIGFNLWMWSSQGIVLAITVPVLLMMLLTMFNLAYGFFVETEARKKLKLMFGQYVPPELVDAMNDSQENYSFEGESREMTVLFSDICGFTSLSERLSATELKQLLNRFFTPMTRAIFDHHGTIDKYVGDMIMAFWGAPIKNEQHAIHAVNAAFEMLAIVDTLKQQFATDGLPEISIGIGINSGQMNVGDMGSVYRRAYTVLGDSVNLASRLEGLTRYYDVDLVIGENTFEQIKDHYDCRQIDLVKVKGKSLPVQIYQPIARKGKLNNSDMQILRRYHDAIDLYRHQDWAGAKELFRRLQIKSPSSKLYQLYLDRIDWCIANPVAKDWDGVFERRNR